VKNYWVKNEATKFEATLPLIITFLPSHFSPNNFSPSSFSGRLTMPIHVDAKTRRLSQSEFGKLAYDVLGEAFRIHAELGRYFHEGIYKEALASRFPNVRLEVPVVVTHRDFRKQYSLDVLVGDGGLFEFKAAEAIVPRHRGQLTNYLILSDLAHGQLINMRPSEVEHEFVNAPATRAERLQFEIDDSRWHEIVPRAALWRNTLTEVLKDWGTGLELPLYEAAMVHFLGGAQAAIQDVDVVMGHRKLGHQPFRVVAPNVAFKLTALESSLDAFEAQSRQLLKQTSLSAILWANIVHQRVTLTTLAR
jgi:GxxExxY protein